MTLEELQGRIVRCTDGIVRRIDRVGPDWVEYSVQVANDAWHPLPRTERSAIECYIVEGKETADRRPQTADRAKKRKTE